MLASGTAPIFHLVSGRSHTLGPYGIVSDITFHPAPLLVLVVATAAYLRGVHRVHAGVGAGRPIVFGGPGISGAPGSVVGGDDTRAAGTAVTRSGEARPRVWIGNGVWPRWRTWSFLAAIAALAVATLSGLTAFERSSFAIVGTQDSLIVFVAPFLLALAAPVTLAMASSSPERAARIRAAFTGRAARVVSYPLVAAVLFGGWLFLVYYTSIFSSGLDHPAVWQLINLGLLLSGLVFAWPMAAVDPLPRPTGHGWRMLWLLLTLPYCTVLGMSLESQTHGIAPGVTPAELQVGGGILWTVGGFLGLFATILVLAQWCRLEERSAARRDRVLDPEAAAQLAHWRANRRIAAEEAGLIPSALPEGLAAQVMALRAAGGEAEGQAGRGDAAGGRPGEALAAVEAPLALPTGGSRTAGPDEPADC